ncbi:Nose resistant to fluoxetine protein 6-like protein, partial [Dinothrombium tinctorium]
MGKPPAGILEGAVTSFGNYHECVKVRVPDDEDEDDEDLFAEEEDEEKNKKPKEFKEFFRGKYCSLEFKPSLPEKPRFYGFETRLPAIPKFPEKENVLNTFSQWAVFLNFIALRFDICIPSLCTKDDLQKILNLVQKLSEVRARVLRCEVEEDTTHISHIQVTTMLLFIVLFFSFGFLTVFGICLGRCKIQSPIINFLKSLTWTHACRELTHTESYNKGDVMPLKDLALSWAAQIMTKSALQFESLIIITAFCIAYYNEDGGFMKAIKQLIRKYFRIMPIVMVTTGIMILLPLAKKSLLGGPTWNDFVPQPSQACQEYGYINLFFIQNFQPPDQMCLPQTWLFCVEMQLALVFVPIMGFVSHFKRSSYLILAALVVAGFAINFYTVYHNNLPPTLMWTLPDPQQRNLYYRVHFFKPWSHLSTFAIGIAAGHYCHNRNRRNYANLPSIHKSLNYQSVARYLIGLICFGAMFACINLFPSWVLGNLPGPILSGVFDGLSKIVWSLCMAFFLYAVTLKVEEEKQSLITRALSSNAYIILGRLTLNAFILHPIVQIVFLATQQAQLFTSMIIAMYSLLGNTVVTYAFSFVLAILFELPLTSLLTARDSSLAYTRQNQNKMMAGNVLGSSNMIMRNGDIEMTKERF